jgi:hypothetical protein
LILTGDRFWDQTMDVIGKSLGKSVTEGRWGKKLIIKIVCLMYSKLKRSGVRKQ